MTSEWSVEKLGDVVDNFDSRRIPVKSVDRRSGPYPYYGASGIIDHVDGYLFEGLHLLVAEDGENLKTRKTPIAFLADGQFWVNNHAHILRGNHRADTRYLNYALACTDISGYLTGSTQPKLTQDNLSRIRLRLPLVQEQRAIASILSALDGKIELNRKMSRTLDETAQAIFKSRFVDFDGMPEARRASEMGSIPGQWDVRQVCDIADVIDCLHSRKPERQSQGSLFLQLSNICDDGVLDVGDAYWISSDDYTLWTSRIEASEGDCVITNVGRVGAVSQVPPEVHAALGRNMTGVRLREDWPYPTFLIELLRSPFMRREIELKLDSGTIMDALNVKSIPKLRFVCPDDESLMDFERLVRPFRRRMEQALSESRLLASVRDTLLPRLLSGELRVRDAEAVVEKAV